MGSVGYVGGVTGLLTHRRRRRARVAAELVYVVACEVILLLAGGTLWIYLFVLIALPSSILPLIASAMGWGGLNELGGGVGGAVLMVMWVLVPVAQVVLGRMAFRRSLPRTP